MRTEGDELDVLADQLNGRESLLLVDNCEHLIDAVAHLVAALLPAARAAGAGHQPRTPRDRRRGAGPARPADAARRRTTAVEQPPACASVRLFTERAAAVRPGFDVDDDDAAPTCVRLVRGLDGMPLALELAAARLRTLSLPELAAGLSDRFRLLTTGSRTALPRHRTLRAVIAWSWDLLGERRAYGRRAGLGPARRRDAGVGRRGLRRHRVPAARDSRAARRPGRQVAAAARARARAATGCSRRCASTGSSGWPSRAPRHRPRPRRPLLRRAGRPRTSRCCAAPASSRRCGCMRTEYDNALAALRHLCDTGNAPGPSLSP